MSDVKEQRTECTVCDHYATCKYSVDYAEFCDRLIDAIDRLDGDIIAEDVAQVEIRCKHFKSITSTPKLSFDLR